MGGRSDGFLQTQRHEAVSLLGRRRSARLEDVQVQEIPGQREAGLDVVPARSLLRRWVWTRRAAQETRESEKLGFIGFARLRADGAAAFRRHVDEVVLGARGGAAREVEAEAEFGEDRHLEADEQPRRD